MTHTRLTSLDAAFLAMETPSTPMHVGSLSLFEGAPLRDGHGRVRIEEIQEVTEERLHLVPRLRQKVMPVPFGIGHPVWVDDADFDITYHVNLISVPPPGTDEQLRRVAEHLHMQLLDRSRPLWEIWFVDGVSGDRVAVIQKLHHCMVDGVSSVGIATTTLDLTPEVTRYDAPEWRPEPAPEPMDLLRESLVELGAEPVRVMRRAFGRMMQPAATIARTRELLTGAGPLTHAPLAPRSSLNQAMRSRRRHLEGVHVSLAEVKGAGKRLDATVNDMVLAAVSGGLRTFLLARREELDSTRLHALVPVSLRAEDQQMALGNLVSSVFAPLPVGEADARKRLDACRASMRELKAQGTAKVTSVVLDATSHLPAPASNALSRLIRDKQPFVNVVVTNVPGPPFALYMGGARMLETVPIVPLSGNLDVSIGIVSYLDDLCLGLYADVVTCPDVHLLAEGIEKAFAELLQLAEEAKPEAAATTVTEIMTDAAAATMTERKEAS